MNNLKLSTKIADQPWELEEVCRLNHQTFSEEIPQHPRTANGLLIDKFHSENQYVLCFDESEIVGLIALRDVRPFSLDSKLENIDDYLPPNNSLCEVRLLIVKPKYRGTKVFYHLFKEVFTQFVKKRYDFALISGILAQQKLYRSIGFVPFGPLVGDLVKFQPMYTSPDFFFKSRHKSTASNFKNRRINALPGPVDVKNIVVEEYRNVSESHRSEMFGLNYNRICSSLSDFVNAKSVQLFTGSGTLANEVMLAHLSTLGSKGLILSNGEFGDRIIHQAYCHKLDFIEFKVDLGGVFDVAYITNVLLVNDDVKWLFFVHCETSTGVLNDFAEISTLCAKNDISLLVDCVSTFGIVPLNLSNVYMASASSGKAIGSYSGLSMVFYNELLARNERGNAIPVYLDIRYYISKNGIPFTLNSNALYALGVALDIVDVNAKFNAVREKSIWLRNQISSLGLTLQPIDSKVSHPGIITVWLPKSMNSLTVGKLLLQRNILVNYNSYYLMDKNMIQICLFSDSDDGDIEYLLTVFKSIAQSLMISSN